MTKLLNTEEIIERAKQLGVDFGKGDPYNRLRYYTKMGWLPHMTRQKDPEGNIRGHYPESVVEQLVIIEKMKTDGMQNEDIAKKLETKNKFSNLLTFIKSKEIRNQLISYATLILLLVIFANESGVISLGKQKSQILQAFSGSQGTSITEVASSGTSFMPKNQSVIFVKTQKVGTNSKIDVTFTQNYSPATSYWVNKIMPGEGFELKTDAPMFEDTTFSWFITK